ncbi:MAG TPA: VOC family protein [Ktedonobacteraceae bacterium]|nr:VOC family protein [Ktedonobacteraceae bacterium]
MAQLNPYLTFDGNCREAMEFYKACLGGELSIMAVGDSPMASDMPDKKDNVLHSMLKTDGMVLMASDMIMPGEIIRGNTITLCINGGSKEELQQFFAKLSEGGTVGQPLTEAFFGTYGELTDKFRINWMFQADNA